VRWLFTERERANRIAFQSDSADLEIFEKQKCLMCAQVAFGIRAVGAQQESPAAAQCQRSQHLANGEFQKTLN
jgi:hypothetical protein